MNKSKQKLPLHQTNTLKIEKFETVTHQLTALKVSHIKQPSQKPSLIIITLLNKIIKTNKEQAFFKIILSGVTQNKKAVIARYLKSILTWRMNEKMRLSFGKVKSMSIRRKKIVNLMNLIGKWMSHKGTVGKKQFFVLLKSHLKDSLINELQKQSKSKSNLKSTSSVDVKSSKTIKSSQKLISENQSKSQSVSQEHSQNKNDQSIKLDKQTEELRVMQLSEQTRQALKKIQRYDKVLYAKESEKVCGEIITNELKRLEKIKNSKRQMRGQFYDNQLTITALHNHIKLIHEINKDLGELKSFKETHTKQQTIKKQQEFNQTMENKRNRGKSVNSQNAIKQILANIQESLVTKNYVKLQSDIHTVLSKYEHEDSVKDKIPIYQALYEIMIFWKSANKGLADIDRISSNFANLNLSQLPQAVKTFTLMKKQLTQISIKDSKEEKSLQNIVASFVKLNEFLSSALSGIQQNHRLKVFQDQNSKLSSLLETQKEKVKSLSEKIKELERVNKQSTLRISSLEKGSQKSVQKSQEKTEHLKRPPIASKSEQTLRQSLAKIQGQLKESNQKNLLFKKELEMLKSQSKDFGADEQNRKQTAFQNQLNKSLVQIQNYIAAKNIKMLEIETNKLQKFNDKDKQATLVITVLVEMLREFLSNEKNKSKSETVSTVSILDFLKNIDSFIAKKEFISGETGWETIEAQIQNEDRIGKSFLRILTKLNNFSKSKIAEQKKSSQKLITNHELQIQKLNKSISQYEKRLKEKEEQYKGIYKSLNELKNDRSKEKNNESASKSVAFRRSVIPQKNSRLNDSTQNTGEQEKIMQEKINRVSKQKNQLSQKNVKLQKQINRLQKANEELRKTILSFQNKQKHQKQTTHGTPQRDLDQVAKLTKANSELLEKVSSLKMEITKTKDYQEQLVLQKIQIALTKQEQDFNKFLLKHDEEIQNHFYNVIIPDKLLSSHKGSHISVNQINEVKQIHFKEEIKQLRDMNTGLREKYEQQYRLSVEHQSQIKSLVQSEQENKAKFEETIKRLKDKNVDFENQIKHYQHNEENIQQYLHAFNISFNEAISGKVSTTIRSLYLQKQQVTTEVVEVVKEIIRQDPKATERIKQLSLQIEESKRMLKEYEVKMSIKESQNLQLKSKSKTNTKIEQLELKVQRLNENLSNLNKKYNSEVENSNTLLNEVNKLKEEQNKLKFQIRKCQSSWQQRLYEQTRVYETKFIEFHEQNKYSATTVNREYDQILFKHEQTDNIRQQEGKDKLLWESKYHELMLIFENKIKEMNDKSLMDLSKNNKEVILLEQKNSTLLNQYSENEQKLKQLAQKFEKENERLERQWTSKIEKKVQYYERRISEITSELSLQKAKSQSVLNNLSEFANYKVHGDDELQKQNLELKQHIESISKTFRKQIEALKEKVNHQKSENQNIQLLLKSAKDQLNISKSQTQKSIEKFENLKMTTEREILILQSDHRQKMEHLIVQNRTISQKMRETMAIEHVPRVVHSEITDEHFKIIELNSQLQNKNELIKQMQQINEMRRKEIQEEHIKLMATERQKQKYRSGLQNMQISMMRVESDNKYLYSEVQRLKEDNKNYQNSKVSYENYGKVPKTDERNAGLLLLEVNMLKQEIRKLKTIQTARNTPYQQTQRSNDFNLQINSKIKNKQLQDQYIQIEDSQYDETQLQILKKCSEEVSRLISANRDLQIKCDILEGREENQQGFYQICQFFFNAKESMESLMGFVSSKMGQNSNIEDKYMQFIRLSKNSLKFENPNEYFELQTIFLQELFIIIIESFSHTIAQRQNQIKRTITKNGQIFIDDNQSTPSEEQTLRKYENIFDDIKRLVKEFLDYGNLQHIKMIWRCLGEE